MIGYVTLGTNDIDKARAFYDALLGEIGATRKMEFPTGFTLYGTGDRSLAWRSAGRTTATGDGRQRQHGGARRQVREQVDHFHAKALELGGSDEGAPGLTLAGRAQCLLRRLFP
jgi:catechol 2,3-dioxygenase-like lactoylglutathione lyase family enzyme